MDRRFVLALLLSALVFFLTPLLFPPAPTPPRAPAPGDSVGPAPANGERATRPAPAAVIPPARDTALGQGTGDMRAGADTIAISTPRARYLFSNIGAALIGAEMVGYRNLARTGAPVELAARGNPLVGYGLIAGGDTIDLREIRFAASRSTRGRSEVLEYRAPVRDGELVIRYTLSADTGASYRIAVTGVTRSIPDVRELLVWLPGTLSTSEADSTADRSTLAYAFMTRRDGARSVGFGSLDPGERELVEGPLRWAAAKTKYFVVGVLTPATGQQPFAAATVAGGARTSRVATHATAVLAQPARAGAFELELYVGPQEWKRLLSVGRDFDQVNPYGWKFLQGIIQPFATIVMRVLLWMHNALALSYGWVLVIFGVAVRVVLWPLNQSAMRASFKMQLLQPKLVEVQKKFANNPERQRAELMKVYKEAGASPFTALSGCLPMLIPMPFLVALFFIFQNTIEFRGVSFLWLTDISIKDPYYILPLFMGVSMYFVSWIGLRNAPPNPQAKMMMYIFPVMMTFFLLNFAAGLNLYYAVQNVATIPQQWLIARQRARLGKAK